MPNNFTTATTTTTLAPDYYILQDYEYEEDIYKIVFNISTRTNLSLQIATVIVNLLHLIVLLRKELRSFAIYIFMIGICISDILTNSLDFTNAAAEIMWIPILFPGSGEMSCLREDYLEINIGAQLVNTFLDISRRLSVWLAILMASIRLLTVIFPMSRRVQNISKPKGAIITLLICITFWVVFCTWQFALYRVFWLPDNPSRICLGMFKNLIKPRYVLGAPESLPGAMSHWGFIEVIMKFSAAIIYPFLTISLLMALRRVKKKRQNLQKKDSDSSDNTTILILFMTTAFMLSEGFAGVEALLLYNIGRILRKNEDLGNAILAAQYPISILRTVNALSHPFVCFLLSSQYRDAVRGIFVGKRKVKKTEFTRSTSNIRSKTTTTTTSF
ncbi:hypothetical protein CRE_19094 [Caenorhabditis remanei]|uniref:G-protein coupled receptors family 1 profile domain-containing protein n=1 Tax=Caenorhabditis remanei TaxID=31234 RepID=E3LJS9_CAERE|nr:hypothetical protein CRE_19094 [Caenorhabditis remanei]